MSFQGKEVLLALLLLYDINMMDSNDLKLWLM